MASLTVNRLCRSSAVCQLGLKSMLPGENTFAALLLSPSSPFNASIISSCWRTMPTFACIISWRSLCIVYGFSPPSRSKGSRAAFAVVSICDGSIVPWPFSFAKIAAYSPARLPKTIRSESELPPRRFAPLIPAAHSPAANSPGTVDSCVSAFTRIPPIT